MSAEWNGSEQFLDTTKEMINTAEITSIFALLPISNISLHSHILNQPELSFFFVSIKTSTFLISVVGN